MDNHQFTFDTIAVIGLGYVGLPLAVELGKKYKVIGFDIDASRIEALTRGVDDTLQCTTEEIKAANQLIFSNTLNDIQHCTVFIVTVPTPVDALKQPDLSPLLKATEMVGTLLKKVDLVIYESTVYPGCTEEDCIPVLEQESGLKFKDDFKVGYSPERINPGDKEHTLQNVVKVVSGCCDLSLDEIAKTYELVVGAGVHRATTIKVA